MLSAGRMFETSRTAVVNMAFSAGSQVTAFEAAKHEEHEMHVPQSTVGTLPYCTSLSNGTYGEH